MPLRRRRAETLGLWDATAMAIGGMVGGGIFTVLGVAVSLAGHLAFGCFLIGAVLAALTARSFAVLAKGSGRSGGLFDYLRHAGHPELAALVSWLLCLGYVLALAVYSSTLRPPSSWPTRASSCSRSTTTTSGTRRAPTPAPR